MAEPTSAGYREADGARRFLYDNIITDQRATGEFTGNWGVLDLMAEFDLTEDQAIKVSDHLPVWAEFSVTEAGSGELLGSRPGSGMR